MTRLPLLALAVSAYLLICAQAPAADFTVPYTCKDDDLQWAGMSCSNESPCPIYVDLSAVASDGPRLFVTGSIHSDTATLYSLLLASDDHGAAWREAAERVRGEQLDQIQFFTLEAGWISGERVVPLPGDPFLLITRDGGKSWRKNPLLPEGSPGYVQSFRFASSKEGRLIIDRGAAEGDELQYHLYETGDGGDTWSVRESSATQVKNPPVVPKDTVWRLRAESGNKEIALEQFTGDRWVAATHFKIQIALCKGIE